MAAYASTVTIYVPKAERISRSLGMIAGKINITNYNTTTTEETGITKYFVTSSVTGITKGIISCVVTSSENGYLWSFDKNTGKFKVYQTSALALTNPSIADTAVTQTALSVAALTSVAAFGSVNEAMKAAISANAVKIRSATKVAIDAAVSATIVKVESAVGAVAGTAAVLTEVADNIDVGEAEFIAVGFIR